MVLTMYGEGSLPAAPAAGGDTARSRVTRDQGILGRDSSDMGVNKSLILAIAPKVTRD